MTVPQIKGIHGAIYSLAPSQYWSVDGNWYYTKFIINNAEYEIATVSVDDEEWFHFPMFLRAIGLLSQEFSDITGFAKSIPYHLKRFYQPFGKGIKRMFINRGAFEQFGLSIDGKPKVKKKYNLKYTGVVTVNINIDAVEHAFLKMMDKLNSMEDRAVLCDVHKILKQIQ